MTKSASHSKIPSHFHSLVRVHDIAVMQSAVFAGQWQRDVAETNGNTCREQRVRTINHVKMQMGFRGVTGVSESGDGLASLDRLSFMDPQTSRHKVGVKGVFSSIMFQN